MNRKNASMKTNGNLEADVHRFQANVLLFLYLLRMSENQKKKLAEGLKRIYQDYNPRNVLKFWDQLHVKSICQHLLMKVQDLRWSNS